MNILGLMSGMLKAKGGLRTIEQYADIAGTTEQLRKNIHKAYATTLANKGVDIRLVSNSYGSDMPSEGLEALMKYEKEIMNELGGRVGIERLHKMVGPDFQDKFNEMLHLQIEDIKNIPDADLRSNPESVLQQITGQHREQIRGWGEQMFVPGQKVNGVEVKDWDTFRRWNRNDSIRMKKAEILEIKDSGGHLTDGNRQEWADLPDMEFEIGEKIRNIDLPHYDKQLKSFATFTNPKTGARYRVEMKNRGSRDYTAAEKGSGGWDSVDHAYINPKTNEIVEWRPGPDKNPRKVLKMDNNGDPIYGERIEGVSKKDVFVPLRGTPTSLPEAHLKGLKKLPDDLRAEAEGIQEAGKKRRSRNIAGTRVGQPPSSISIGVGIKPMARWEAATEAEIIKKLVDKYGLPDDSPPRLGFNKKSDDMDYVNWFKNKFTSDEVTDLAPQGINLVQVHDEFIDTLSKALKSRSSKEATDMMNIAKDFGTRGIQTSDNMSSKSAYALSVQSRADNAVTGEVGSRAYRKRQAIRDAGGVPGEVSVHQDTFQMMNTIDRTHASGPLSGLQDYRNINSNEYGNLNAIWANQSKGSMDFTVELDPIHYIGKNNVILNASEDVKNLPTVDKGARRIITGGLYEGVGIQGLRKPREAVDEAVKKISGPFKQPVPPEELLKQAEKIGKKEGLLRTSTDVVEAVRDFLTDTNLKNLKKITGNDTPVQYVKKTLAPAIKRGESELQKGFGKDFKLVFKIEEVPTHDTSYFSIRVFHSKVEVAGSLSKATLDKKIMGALPALEGIRWEYGGEK